MQSCPAMLILEIYQKNQLTKLTCRRLSIGRKTVFLLVFECSRQKSEKCVSNEYFSSLFHPTVRTYYVALD